MSKKTKLKDLLIVAADPDSYHVYADAGNGFEHGHTITIRTTESDTMYSMYYSENAQWSEETRGANIFNLLNTRSGFTWVDTVPESSLTYDDMYNLQVFLRFIQDIEASPKYTTKILKVEEVSSYNF